MNTIPILIVDDTAAHRALLKRALVRSGFLDPIVEAESVESAMSFLFGSDPPPIRAAVIDLNLGDGRGSVLVSRLRRHDGYRAVPLLILSTSDLQSDMQESYSAGADCYVVKSDDFATYARDICAALTYLLSLP